MTIRLTDKAVEREIFFNPELKAAEAYMDGRMVIENGGKVYDLLLLFSVNRTGLAAHPVQKTLRKVWRALRRRQQNNKLGLAAKNVQHHYDIPTKFYELWLDETMTYSCAYYTSPDKSLYQAQMDKLRHIAAKLKLEPGMHVAEIGSGWGALAIYLAKYCGVKVTAINVSTEQLAASRLRAIEAGVADQIDFREVDYREISGQFDRVVSIGMMEHVGVGHFDSYFTHHSRVAEGGRLRIGACDWTHVTARHDGAVHPEVYLSRWLCAGSVRGVRLAGAHGHLVRRLRESAAALLLDDPRLAARL